MTTSTSPGVVSAPRVIAAVLAGGAVAAAGQAALTRALPVAADGTNVLKLSVQELVGTAATTAGDAAGTARATGAVPTAAPLVTLPAEITPAAEPPVATASDLATAAQRQAQGVTDAPAPAQVAVTGDVQMVTGRVSSGFGTRWGHSHNGIDIAAPIGTPIRAPLAGEVVASGPASGFGLWVRVRHDDGTITTYGHVNRSLVKVGDEVTAGEEIAEVGNRGHSTGPHLHMEVRTPEGTVVNPRPWLDGHGISY